MTLCKSAFIGTLLVFLCGCHGYASPPKTPETCPETRVSYDLTLCWKIDRGPTGFIVSGYATNTRFAYIEGLQLTVSVIDAAGKTLGETNYFFIPNQIAMDDDLFYSMAVPLRKAGTPAKLRFKYQYSLTKLDDGGTPYFSSFEADIPKSTD